MNAYCRLSRGVSQGSEVASSVDHAGILPYLSQARRKVERTVCGSRSLLGPVEDEEAAGGWRSLKGSSRLHLTVIVPPDIFKGWPKRRVLMPLAAFSLKNDCILHVSGSFKVDGIWCCLVLVSNL